MKKPEDPNINIRYFNITHADESWGIAVTTVGYQSIPPHSSYPPSQHPESHHFNPKRGRTLKEYALVYISHGCGYFESKSCKKQKIKAGTMILLFPDEWHSYEPDQETGWSECWICFKGEYIDKQIKNGFFSPKHPLYRLGFSSAIVSLYEEIVNYASQEKAAYQQMISSMTFYLLSSIYYKHKNTLLNDSLVIKKMNEARQMMRQEIDKNISPKSIAESLGVGYSWFRKMFKQYTDISPAQYQANLKYIRCKELLDTTDMSITEIAYQLNFENASQFSTFFRRKAGIPPLQYRKETK